jgi:anti-sigma factor RsiW
MTSERDVHPDDGTIHAWLDRQLDDTSAATLEAHLQRCDECSERVAEARGLIAGASRILSSLDVDAAPTA